MKKATMLTREDWDNVDLSEHKKHFKGDDTLSNYGFYEGRLVKVDYASLDKFWGSDFKPNK